MRSIVRLRGWLRGMEHESPCVLLAWKETLRPENGLGSFKYVYSRPQMLEAPPDLPDGEYEIGFGEQRVPMTKRRGIWLTHWSEGRGAHSS